MTDKTIKKAHENLAIIMGLVDYKIQPFTTTQYIAWKNIYIDKNKNEFSRKKVSIEPWLTLTENIELSDIKKFADEHKNTYNSELKKLIKNIEKKLKEFKTVIKISILV